MNIFQILIFHLSRKAHPILPTYSTGVKNIDIVSVVKDIGELVKEGVTLQDKFTRIAKNESSCSATMFFKAK